MTTLDTMDNLIHNARTNGNTPHHFRATTDHIKQWREDLRLHVRTAAAHAGQAYRGIPVVEDEGVAGVALVVEEEPFRVEA